MKTEIMIYCEDTMSNQCLYINISFSLILWHHKQLFFSWRREERGEISAIDDSFSLLFLLFMHSGQDSTWLIVYEKVHRVPEIE